MVRKWVRDNACLTSTLQITDKMWLSTQSVVAWCIHKKVIAKPTFSLMVVCVDSDLRNFRKSFQVILTLYKRWYDLCLERVRRRTLSNRNKIRRYVVRHIKLLKRSLSIHLHIQYNKLRNSLHYELTNWEVWWKLIQSYW